MIGYKEIQQICSSLNADVPGRVNETQKFHLNRDVVIALHVLPALL